METTIVKRTGDFKVVEQGKAYKGYQELIVDCTIYNKKAQMVIRDGWDDPKVEKWMFVTGDPIVDSQAKQNINFSAFEMLDVQVDTTDIRNEAKEFFNMLKEEAKAKEEEINKMKRAEAYDNNEYINKVKPLLEGKGFAVEISITKEDFVEKNGRIELIINNEFELGYDYHGWAEARNLRKDYNLRIRKTTKSTKPVKIVELVKEVIETDEAMMKILKAKAQDRNSAKETLETNLGIKVECRKGARDGYATEYFINVADKENYSTIRFVEGSNRVDGQYVKGFKLENIPVITDMAKLKKIYDLLMEK